MPLATCGVVNPFTAWAGPAVAGSLGELTRSQDETEERVDQQSGVALISIRSGLSTTSCSWKKKPYRQSAMRQFRFQL